MRAKELKHCERAGRAGHLFLQPLTLTPHTSILFTLSESEENSLKINSVQIN